MIYNQPKRKFIEVLNRSFLITINNTHKGYEVLTPKFRGLYVFDKDMDCAIEQMKVLIEGKIRLLLKDIVKVVKDEPNR